MDILAELNKIAEEYRGEGNLKNGIAFFRHAVHLIANKSLHKDFMP